MGTLVSTNYKSTVKYISKMSKYIILFIFYFVLQISAKEGLDVFQKFKSDFGRQYATEEEESVKFNIFLNNLEKIREHNSRPRDHHLRPKPSSLWWHWRMSRIHPSAGLQLCPVVWVGN